MYPKNTIGRRRSSGWADRRRYYRRLFEQARSKPLREGEPQKAAPVNEKD